MLIKSFHFMKFYKYYYPVLVSVLLTTGCSAIGKIENRPISELPTVQKRYSTPYFNQHRPVGDNFIYLAFSGGGTRAAALSYGLLEELRDTRLHTDGQEIRLLDDVDRISSVSGGSFTSAYYGLFGDQIFDDFKDVFLYEDVQGNLSNLVFDFFNILERLFTDTSRTETAINYYDKHIFRGKTFADIQNSGGPMILINASDLNAHSQFIFTQGQFDFLCSNLSDFKVARAVAASSAVPVLFRPILIERHDDCNFQKPTWLADAEKRLKNNEDGRLKETVTALNFYLDKDNPPYVTLVDGGVTDNLGLRTILRTINVAGGAKKVYQQALEQGKTLKPPKRMVVMVVNASTTSETNIGINKTLPSIGDTLSALTDMQLHLYNTETNSLIKKQLIEWSQSISTKEHPIIPYFIELDVSDIKDPQERLYFNRIPTSFSLEKEQADRLIETAKRLLRQNSEYQKLLKDLGASTSDMEI